jgi:hypothetical protein
VKPGQEHTVKTEFTVLSCRVNNVRGILISIFKHYETQMSTTKEEVKSLLEKLSDECTLEDVQYHLYVVEKIQKGIKRANNENTLNQSEVEKEFSQWTTQ